MKIALGQINTTVGDFDGNVEKMLAFARQAERAGAALIIFPELALTGYPPRDLVDRPSFVEANLKALQDLARKAPAIAILVGTIGRNPEKGEKPFFNAAVLLEKGKVLHSYQKRLLPFYDVFEEVRHFESGKSTSCFPFRGKKLGVNICEDMWNDRLFLEKSFYKVDPIDEEVQAGVDLLINLSASPFVLGKAQFRIDLVSALALKHDRPFLMVNLVGGNDELIFDGHSLAVNNKGDILALGKGFEEDLIIVDLDGASLPDAPATESEEAQAEAALVLGIHDYVAKCGFEKVVVGLSGGIDSSLVAALAVLALGAKNVVGVSMPSPYNSPESHDDAEKLAKNLGIEFLTIPIDLIYQSYGSALKKEFGTFGTEISEQNIQARIRGNILMALSNKKGYLVLSTGNKSELAVGYCTLYGDMSGGLAVISDIPKQFVYRLARFINRQKKWIPERVFQKAPSAELAPNQTDQQVLPPYEVLDQILECYIEDQKSADEIIAEGFDRQTVEKVTAWVKKNEYKRRQAAPGIKVTGKAFGMGRRYPIARK